MRREHKPLNNEGVLALAEKVVEQAANDYVRLWAWKLAGRKDTSGRMKQLELFFRESPFMLGVDADYDEVIKMLRMRGQKEYENKKEVYKA